MPFKAQAKVRHKFDKKKYGVRNWPAYDKALKNRGDITIWFTDEAIKSWKANPTHRAKGAQPVYSDLAIETGLTIRTVFHLGLRQAEGFLESLKKLLKLNISIPDHTTLSRRRNNLIIKRWKGKADESVVVLIDSSGLKVFGEGEWLETKHGAKKRKVWRKLHLTIDRKTGLILSFSLTSHTKDDASEIAPLVDDIEDDIYSLTGDGAYDRDEIYEYLHSKGIEGIFPPRKDAVLSDEAESNPTTRDKNIKHIKKHGRMSWQKEVNYNDRSLVEVAVYRYKTLIGRSLRSRNRHNQETEAAIGCSIINKMTNLGMPESYVIS